MLIGANKNYLRLRSVGRGSLSEGVGCVTVTQCFSRAVQKKNRKLKTENKIQNTKP